MKCLNSYEQRVILNTPKCLQMLIFMFMFFSKSGKLTNSPQGELWRSTCLGSQFKQYQKILREQKALLICTRKSKWSSPINCYKIKMNSQEKERKRCVPLPSQLRKLTNGIGANEHYWSNQVYLAAWWNTYTHWNIMIIFILSLGQNDLFWSVRQRSFLTLLLEIL